jgi:hypothetical protein
MQSAKLKFSIVFLSFSILKFAICCRFHSGLRLKKRLKEIIGLKAEGDNRLKAQG